MMEMFRWVTRWLHRGCRREYVSLLKRLGEAERASWRIVDSDGDSVTVEFGERVMVIKRPTGQEG